MKKLLVLIVGLLIANLAVGQRLDEGETQINAGVGFNTSGWGIPVYAGVDFGILPNITVGGILSYTSKSYTYEEYKNNGTWIGLGARGDFHFNSLFEIPDDWDLYGGLTLSYNHFSYDHSWKANYSNYNDSGIGLSIQVGGRYYFSEQWAINLELGGSSVASGGKLGVSFKF